MICRKGFGNIIMLVGYARVSTMDQNPSMQMDALRAAGCEKFYVEQRFPIYFFIVYYHEVILIL